MEKIAVECLNKRFDGLQMSVSDVQSAHRLQGDKVIVRFVKRRLRDISDGRFDMNRRGPEAGLAAALRPRTGRRL